MKDNSGQGAYYIQLGLIRRLRTQTTRRMPTSLPRKQRPAMIIRTFLTSSAPHRRNEAAPVRK
jgi:hypothetical protein